MEPQKSKNKTQADGGGKFLTFYLGEEEYGIEILKVQEIIPMMPVTRVPRTPDAVKGVINLRGKIIPVMDIRLKFGMEAREYDSETCVIVVQKAGPDLGVIVDRVCEVLDIDSADVEDVPAFGMNVNTEFLLGIGNTNGRVRLLLNLEKVLANPDISEVSTAMSGLAA
jgi:purine-binding chemotaxis protein CheW